MANKVIIIADSTIDLNPDYIKENNIQIIPLHVSFRGDETDYLDGVNLNAETVYKKVQESGFTPTTGAANVNQFVDFFKPFIDDGYDLIVTGIGSTLSSSYQNAILAMQEFPEGRIEVVDSQNLSTGTGLLVCKMVDFRNQGDDVHEIARKVRELVPLVSAKFCIDRLDYLHKGGRCSGMTKLLAHFLNLHPIAKVIDGKLTVYKTPRGKYRKAVDAQIQEFLDDLPNIDLTRVFVTDSGHMDGESDYIIEELAKHMDRSHIIHTTAGCVISSHCGPKTVGILYILKERKD